MKTAVIKKKQMRVEGGSGEWGQAEKKRERGGESEREEEEGGSAFGGKLLKKVQAGWLGSSSRGVGPRASPAPKWQLLAPPLNTQCLVAKLCLSLTDEWGKGREGVGVRESEREGGGDTKYRYWSSLFFKRWGEKRDLT